VQLYSLVFIRWNTDELLYFQVMVWQTKIPKHSIWIDFTRNDLVIMYKILYDALWEYIIIIY